MGKGLGRLRIALREFQGPEHSRPSTTLPVESLWVERGATLSVEGSKGGLKGNKAASDRERHVCNAEDAENAENGGNWGKGQGGNRNTEDGTRNAERTASRRFVPACRGSSAGVIGTRGR